MKPSFDENLNALIDRVGTVRRWLVALAILKVAAICIVFVVVYIIGYSLLDHYYNFSFLGRSLSLALLIGIVVVLLYSLVRFLLVHISYSGAANYIEQRNNFDQQLVAAVEYYENRDNYPYSRTLAEQLVMHVCRVSQGLRFDATINKWHGYLLGVVIIMGVTVFGVFAGKNLAYIRPYLARLALPIAKIDPVSSTTLTPITTDLVVGTDSTVEFSALIEGKLPDSGKFQLSPMEQEADISEDTSSIDETAVEPVTDQDQKSRFKAKKLFTEVGEFKYRFEAGPTSTQWQNLKICDPPSIKRITAEVTLPQTSSPKTTLEPYVEDINDGTIEVVPGSMVKLSVQATCPLNELSITSPDGQNVQGSREGSDVFTFGFKAEKESSMEMKLISADGLPNKEPANIQVVLKTDKPPEFKLLSPEGDYLATNVSSVPIEFQISDDFGLDSAELYLEFQGRDPVITKAQLEPGSKRCLCSLNLELEQYDLNVGDSILFYAKAQDVDTGIVGLERSASSEIYFIEIRSYHQFLHPKAGGGKGQGAGGAAEDLLTILEYTRAAIKKTWNISEKGVNTSEDSARINSICDDIQYCASELTDIRDDPEYGWTDPQKTILSDVLQCYEQAQGHLKTQKASQALIAEKDAYRILRKFVDEMNIEWSPPSQGGGQQPPKPDKIKLQESSPFRGYEKERIEEELKSVQNKIDKLQQDQKAVKMDFKNFLEQQSNASKRKQSDQATKTLKKDAESPDSQQAQGQQNKSNENQTNSETESSADSKSSSGQSSGKPGDQSKSKSQGQGANQSDQNSQNKQSSSPGDAKAQADNAEKQVQGPDAKENSPSQSDNKNKQSKQSQGAKSKEGRGQSNSDVSTSNSDEQGSKKSDSQGQQGSSSSSKSGESTSNSQSAPQGHSQSDSAATEARLRMFQAKQKQLQEAAEALKRELQNIPLPTLHASEASKQTQQHMEKAIENMEQFQQTLDEAKYQPATDTSKATQATELLESAERQLALAENKLAESTSGTTEQQLAEKAQKIAEQLAEDADALNQSLSLIEQQQMQARLEAAKQLLKQMSPAQWSQMRKGGGSSGNATVYTMDSYKSKADMARAISREFWSIAIQAKKGKQKAIGDSTSDIKFRQAEIEFFKNAAKYNREHSSK